MKKKIIEIEKNVLIDEFVKVSMSIETIYKKLFELDNRNKKNSKEYIKFIDYLSIALDVEKKIYESISLNKEECNELIKSIIDDRIGKNPLNDFDNIILLRNQYNSLRRIINALEFKMNASEIKEQLEDIDFYEKAYIEDLNTNLYRKGVIANELLVDIINSFILFLDEKIIDKRFENIRSDLLKAKYNLFFIFKENENRNINNHFEKVERIEDYTRFFSFILHLTSEEHNLYIRKELVKYAIKQIYKMLYTKEEYSSLIIRSCLLRGLFLLMDDTTLMEVSDYMNSLHNFNNSDAEKILGMCFYKIKEDSDKQIRLKL